MVEVGAASALSFGVNQNERVYILWKIQGCAGPSPPPTDIPHPRKDSPQDEDYEIPLGSSIKDCFLIESACFGKIRFYQEKLGQDSKSAKGHNYRAEKPVKITNTQEPVNSFQVTNHTQGSHTNHIPFSDCHQILRRFGANVVTTFSMR